MISMREYTWYFFFFFFFIVGRGGVFAHFVGFVGWVMLKDAGPFIGRFVMCEMIFRGWSYEVC
jgi:hypothetical protein